MEPPPTCPAPDGLLQVPDATSSSDPGLRRPSAVALVAANLVPLYGALFLGWETFPVLLLFWVENVIIGVFNVLKILFAGQGHLTKVFLLPFFCVHYGIFTMVHGVFVIGFFGGAFGLGTPVPTLAAVQHLMEQQHLAWAVFGLFLSHAISFVLNYLRGGEYRQANPAALLMQPYGRVIVMHLTILLGAFILAALRTPTVALVLLVGLKLALDLRAHLRERRKFAPTP
ncbi:MAG: hypothetical protein IT578_09385 [Verrucomicrobiae bacterium]|nr:hypothetical protein [Verrucomicrobiae bacterium]